MVQQGMNEGNRYARRYHWLGEGVESFVCEPHQGIWAARPEPWVLNLVAREKLLGLRGVGPRTVRELALLAELL